MTDDIDPDLPIRLAEIIPIVFPLGGITPVGLRKEAVRGRLVLMRIAGKDFTTINAVREMMLICAAPRAPLEPVVDPAMEKSVAAASSHLWLKRWGEKIKQEALEKKQARLAERQKWAAEKKAKDKQERQGAVAARRAMRKAVRAKD